MDIKYVAIIAASNTLIECEPTGDVICLSEHTSISYDGGIHVYQDYDGKKYEKITDVAGFTKLETLRNNSDVAELLGPLTTWHDTSPLGDNIHTAVIEPYLIRFVNNPKSQAIRNITRQFTPVYEEYYIALDIHIIPTFQVTEVNLSNLEGFRWKQDPATELLRQKSLTQSQ